MPMCYFKHLAGQKKIKAKKIFLKNKGIYRRRKTSINNF